MTMPPDSIDALLFDLGGVVIEIDFERVFAHWAQAAGVSERHIRSHFGDDAPHQAYQRGEITDEAYFGHLRDHLQLPLSHDQLVAGWNAIFVGEMAGIGPLLAEAARARPLYAFSNTNRAHELCWSRAFASVLAHFQEVFVSSTIGLAKPDRVAFDHVAQAMGVAPERILFFDDLAANVIGARAAGFNAVQVKSTADIRRALASMGIVAG